MKIFNKSIEKTYSIEKLVMEQYGASKASFFIYMILRAMVLLLLVLSIVNKHYEYVGYCILTIVFFCLPPFFERTFNADIPTVFEIIVLFFAFSANILGEIFAFYVIIPCWDTILHTIYGFICAALGFSLIDLMNKDTSLKFKMNPTYLCFNSFGITMAIAVLWEFFECFMDNVFGKDMQKDTVIHNFQTVLLDDTNSNIAVKVNDIHEVTINGELLPLDGYIDIGLLDTMKDLAVAALGALIFCFFLYRYLKTKGESKFATVFIPARRNWKKNPAEVEASLAKRILNLETELEELKNERDENQTYKPD